MTRYLVAALLAGIIFLCADNAVSRPVAGVTPVADIRFVYPGELPENLHSLVGIKKGDPFSQRQVKESIRLIFLIGRFRDVIVSGEDTPEGVVLTYTLVPKIAVRDIYVIGNDELSGRAVESAMSLGEGDFIEPGLLEGSRQSIIRLYRDSGYRDAVVYVTEIPVEELHSDLEVLVSEGPPAVVGDIRFTGKPVLPEKDMLDELEFSEGDVLTKADIDLSIENLTALYVDNNYVNIEVQRPEISYAGPVADVAFGIEPGPLLDVSFEGNDELSEGTLKDELTFWSDKDISPESVSENIDRLTRLYREKGYYHAAVTARTEEGGAPPVVNVRFIIAEGPRAALTQITIVGNAGLEDDEVRAVMELTESSVFRDRFITDDAVQRDLERIGALYETNGFLDARVSAGEIEFSEGGEEASIRIIIEEGPRTYVAGIIMTGNSGVPDADIYAQIKQEAGVPLNPQQLTQDKNAMLNLYSQRGYIHATVEVRRELLPNSNEAVVTFEIQEGFPVYIGNIILSGNSDVRDVVVYRELLFAKGDVYDYEKILRSQQRIYRLGIMSKVRIQPVRPDKAEEVKDILVSVKEREAGSVEFGVGYGEFDLFRGFAEVSYRNLFGYGHVVTLRGEASARETKGVVSYKWPWFMGNSLDFRSSMVYLDAEKPNYDIEDFILSAGFDKSLTENITASLVYQYEKLQLSAPAGAILAPEDKDKSNLASITPSVIFDFRDNPFNATSGSFHGLVIKWASSSFGSTVDFVKVTGQTSWYFPVYKGIVFGISARGGIEGYFGGKLEVPISERFFLGGASTLRGYDFESVAPLGFDGTPAGGDSMVLFNAEMRFPLPYGFGIVGFLDAGNVWLMNKNVSFATLSQRGTNGLRYGAGIGLRYDTPVGPLRLDYGVKLNPLADEPAAVLHFTLGQAF